MTDLACLRNVVRRESLYDKTRRFLHFCRRSATMPNAICAVMAADDRRICYVSRLFGPHLLGTINCLCALKGIANFSTFTYTERQLVKMYYLGVSNHATSIICSDTFNITLWISYCSFASKIPKR